MLRLDLERGRHRQSVTKRLFAFGNFNMLKTMTALEAIELDRGFARRVTSVAIEGRRLTESYADLSARMLEFAVQFRELWLDAKRLDKAESGQHQLYLRKALSDAVQSDDPSVWSKWNTIGSQAKTLLRYKTALPPQRVSTPERFYSGWPE